MTAAPDILSRTPECLDALIQALRFLLHTPEQVTARMQQEGFCNGRTV